MTDTIDDEVALGPLFDFAKNLVKDIDEGHFSTRDLQERIKEGILKLEQLTLLVNKLALFSSNEMIEDVPTDSLQFLLVPCFLGIFYQNTVTDPKEKLETLRKARVYFRNFLERLRSLALIEDDLPWEDDDDNENKKAPMNPTDARNLKLERHRRKQHLKKVEADVKRQLEAVAIDDGNLRDLYVTQLTYWSIQAFDELASIEEEIPMAEMMSQRASNSSHPAPQPSGSQPVKRAPMKPFIITRDAKQKQVFGLGYPSVPTLTVDEWYHQRFGCGGGPASASQAGPPAGGDANEPNSDEEDDDEKRAKAMRWDEYKDDHRRGWGNTHNKG